MTTNRNLWVLLIVIAAVNATTARAQELKLEPIPLPQSEVSKGPTLAPSANLPSGGTFVIEPPVVVNSVPPPPVVVNPVPPPPIIQEGPTTVVPLPATVRPAPVKVVTHYVYRPRLGTFVPVSVTVQSPPAAAAAVQPVQTVTTVIVPRHVPGQPMRNAMRRRMLLP